MPTLHEIPGAIERPADSRILLSQKGEMTNVEIPAASPNPVILAVSVGLSLCLTLAVYVGVMLFFFGRSVFFMTQISPEGLPVQLRPFVFWMIFGWIFLLGCGFFALSVILRPLFSRETLTFSSSEIVLVRRFFVQTQRQIVPMENVSGFVLRRDPQGFTAGKLTLRAGREKIVIGEYAREDEREWLTSVGNVILRN